MCIICTLWACAFYNNSFLIVHQSARSTKLTKVYMFVHFFASCAPCTPFALMKMHQSVQSADLCTLCTLCTLYILCTSLLSWWCIKFDQSAHCILLYVTMNSVHFCASCTPCAPCALYSLIFSKMHQSARSAILCTCEYLKKMFNRCPSFMFSYLQTSFICKHSLSIFQ